MSVLYPNAFALSTQVDTRRQRHKVKMNAQVTGTYKTSLGKEGILGCLVYFAAKTRL